METVAPGYSRPVQHGPVSRSAERVVAHACPGAQVARWGEAPNRSPIWGPWFRIDTGHASDPTLRHTGSSGGALSALAVHALRTGLVDRVIHVAADPDRPTRNVVQVSTTEAEIVAGAGSRYAASSPLAQIESELTRGGSMAFIGKPCDVSALRQLAQLDPRVDEHVKLFLSFFCGGIPSHDGVGRILGAMGINSDEVSTFRYRGNGWPGKAVATTHSGQTGEMSYAESWGDFLSKEVQFRCKICPDAVGGVADIACADAWYGGETGYPTFEELDGRSLIVTRSEIGQEFLLAAEAAGALSMTPMELREVDLMQPSQASRKRLVRARLAALTATLQPQPNVVGLMVAEASRSASKREQLKNFLGTIRRIVVRRR